jgi:hypothetical protein
MNNAIGQALLAKRVGKPRIISETCAGQHGVATATICAKLGLDCSVYMGSVDYDVKSLMSSVCRHLEPRLSPSMLVRIGCHERGDERLGDQRPRHLLPYWRPWVRIPSRQLSGTSRVSWVAKCVLKCLKSLASYPMQSSIV